MTFSWRCFEIWVTGKKSLEFPTKNISAFGVKQKRKLKQQLET